MDGGDVPGRLAWILARTSSRVFAGALAVAMAALALTLHQRQQNRDFSEPTTITMGAVLDKGALLRRSRRSSSEWFCWVSYEFTPAAGGARQSNWRLWEPGCGVSPGRPIPIQYVIVRPEINRPAGETLSFPTSLLWFAAGVILVVGVLLRRSELE
jgi:hypothetical protein